MHWSLSLEVCYNSNTPEPEGRSKVHKEAHSTWSERTLVWKVNQRGDVFNINSNALRALLIEAPNWIRSVTYQKEKLKEMMVWTLISSNLEPSQLKDNLTIGWLEDPFVAAASKIWQQRSNYDQQLQEPVANCRSQDLWKLFVGNGGQFGGQGPKNKDK